MSATPIANYLGQIAVWPIPVGEHHPYLIPCWQLNFHDGLKLEACYSAASSPGPDVFPDQSEPGILEFWGPWRLDFNPYVSTPNLSTGQTVQIAWSIYAGTYDAIMPQGCIALIESFTDMKIARTPFWHIVAFGTWAYTGLAQSAPNWSRIQGGDVNADTNGFA